MSPQRSIHPRCPRCFFRTTPCLCADIPALPTRLRILVVRHAAERSKQSNSARWAALALPSCRLVDYALTPEPFDEHEIDPDDAVLLFPGPGDPTPRPARPPSRLVVVDGTWQQARRMVARLAVLRTMPRLTLPPPPPRPRYRTPHLQEGMSTLEALAGALDWAGEAHAAEGLRALYDLIHARADLQRGAARPEKGR